MSDKKRSRRRKDEYTGPGGVQEEIDKPSKEEYAVAKWLKNNVRTKRTKFLSHNVEYFTATKALDALMNSKFADGNNCLFPTREHAIEFLDLMLEHRFFHRAKKVPVFLEDFKCGGGSSGSGSGKLKAQKSSVNEKESIATASSTNSSGNAGTVAATTLTKRDTNKDEKDKGSENIDSQMEGCCCCCISGEELMKEKRKRKIKLDMHPEQVFVDGSEAYVWIYDPVPIHYWIYGLALVLGAILLCLFPLWPPILRKGVYYLSVAAAGFLVFILVLTIVRLIIFVIVWILSGGKLYFWIFPNLTEDVGFLASFWPLYESEYYVESGSSKSQKKSKKKKKDKDSDAEDETTSGGVSGRSGSGGGGASDGNDHHHHQKRPLLLEAEKIENIKENETGSIPITSSSPDQIEKEISNQEYDNDYKGDDDDDNDDDGDDCGRDGGNPDKGGKKRKVLKNLDIKSEKRTTTTKIALSTGTDAVGNGIDTGTTTITTPTEGKENTTPSESESEGSRSSTGKDFEILDATEVVAEAAAGKS